MSSGIGLGMPGGTVDQGSGGAELPIAPPRAAQPAAISGTAHVRVTNADWPFVQAPASHTDADNARPIMENLVLRKLASVAGLSAIALSLLSSPASAEPAYVDNFRSSDYSAGLSSTSVTAAGYTFRYVSFGRSQSSWDGPMVASASFYESVMSGSESYTVSGSLSGQEAAAAYTLRGLNGGELHADIPVQVCSSDYETWTETCVDGGTRRVDATVTAVQQGGVDTVRLSIPKAQGCSGCWTESMIRNSRPADGTLSIDGVVSTEPLTAFVGHNVGSVHMLGRPALADPTL